MASLETLLAPKPVALPRLWVGRVPPFIVLLGPQPRVVHRLPAVWVPFPPVAVVRGHRGRRVVGASILDAPLAFPVLLWPPRWAVPAPWRPQLLPFAVVSFVLPGPRLPSPLPMVAAAYRPVEGL